MSKSEVEMCGKLLTQEHSTPPTPTSTTQRPQKCQVCLKRQTARGQRVDARWGRDEGEAKFGMDPRKNPRPHEHSHTFVASPVDAKSQGMAL